MEYPRNDNLVTETCCACGIVFAITASMLQHLKSANREFTCPNGHRQSYTDKESERLRKELADVTTSREYWKAEFERREKKLAYLKGQVTRWKNLAQRLPKR